MMPYLLYLDQVHFVKFNLYFSNIFDIMEFLSGFFDPYEIAKSFQGICFLLHCLTLLNIYKTIEIISINIINKVFV